MPSKTKTILSWSSGKDSAWALHALRNDPALEVVGLCTVVNAKYDRVSMHGVRTDLLRRQAESVRLPLHVIPIPDQCSMEDCESRLRRFVEESAGAGVERMAFGDLFLGEVRTYREEQLRGTGMEPLFPLWHRPTDTLARQMLLGGLRAFVTCVDTRKLPGDYVGRELTTALLDQLPATVDPCAENGEFHTVAVAGPMFGEPIEVRIGEVVQRDAFAFADVIPVAVTQAATQPHTEEVR